MPTMSFNQFYKSWRNKARKFCVPALVHGALTALHTNWSNKLDEMKGAPWNLMLIVKWACLDKQLSLSGPQMSQEALAELRNDLWNLGEKVDHAITPNRPWRLWMRQLLFPQMEFQRHPDAGFLREAALLEQLGFDHPLCRMFEAATGFDVRLFQDISFALFSEMLTGRLIIETGFFRPFLQDYTNGAVMGAIEALSVTPNQLVAFVRATSTPERYISEYFEFSPLQRHPFLRQGNSLQLWHPMIFFRGIEGFVHNVLSDKGSEYIERFSKTFETHVVGEARKVTAAFFDESEIQRWLPRDSRSPDCLLSFDNCNVFVEAKAGLFAPAVMTAGDIQALASRARALRTGANQAWAAVEAISVASDLPCGSATENYLLVITNKELGISHGENIQGMTPPGWFDPPTPKAAALLPPAHIYFVPVQDYERLMVAAQRNEIDLPSFLRRCVELDADPATAVLFMQQRLEKEKVRQGFSDLVVAAVEASAKRLERMVLADQAAHGQSRESS